MYLVNRILADEWAYHLIRSRSTTSGWWKVLCIQTFLSSPRWNGSTRYLPFQHWHRYFPSLTPVRFSLLGHFDWYRLNQSRGCVFGVPCLFSAVGEPEIHSLWPVASLRCRWYLLSASGHPMCTIRLHIEWETQRKTLEYWWWWVCSCRLRGEARWPVCCCCRGAPSIRTSVSYEPWFRVFFFAA